MKALLLDALRALRKRPGATAVAAGGLMLALATTLLVGLLALALASTDPAIPEPERIVMLDFKGNPPGQPSDWFAASPVAFGSLLKHSGAPLDLIARSSDDGFNLRLEGELQPLNLVVADPELVSLFGWRALAGDLRATLQRRDALALTQSLVRRLWGELAPQQALGRSLESNGKVYVVTAVIPDPDARNPLSDYQLLAGFDGQANALNEQDQQAIFMVNGRVFARLRPGGTAAEIGPWMREAFRASPGYAQLPADWKDGREAAYFRGLPLVELPFAGAENGMRWLQVGALGAASALLLLLAAINTMNLQAAQLLQRQRETALRRSLGAAAPQLLQLWATELLLPLLLAGAGALLLAWWLAPALAAWLGLPPALNLADPPPRVALVGLLGVCALLLPLALALPAWAALRRAPAPALQGRTASEGPWGRRVRQLLLALQLAGALLLLALTGVLALQHRHLLQADRGFATENRLVMTVWATPADAPKAAPLLAALNRHPAVQHWGFSSAVPARDTRGQQEVHVSASGHKQVLRLTRVSPGYFATYGMRWLAGEPRASSGEKLLVLDERAARALGFATPQAALGAVLRGGGDYLQEGQDPRRVVGVVAAVKQEGVREAPQAQGFLVSDEPQGNLTLYGPDLPALRAALDQAWKDIGAPLVRYVRSVDEQRSLAYRQEAQLAGLLAALALLAVGVAALGAYALVADTLRRRRTELVLRRLHGAGGLDIVRSVISEFRTPMALAALLALPLAAWLGSVYLAGFQERVAPLPGLLLPLLSAALLTLAVLAGAVVRHVRLALALRPIDVLN
ncbi:FtsX-like permease family protein [Inhella proteolytica]|uniref:FtsX-like permease family protein n=1 Tax=Inhella proteolytica TaxID=2795029 RepID=A0A931NJF6_9BURK|nr:FtsX-like permease family protein [Inhella proteolytica]MBH9578585.1 FtsX-like permease family protein [Inhella proteolytica]